MIKLATLRVTTHEAVPFVREKLREALRIGGVRASAAGETAAMFSQAARRMAPVEATDWLESHPSAIVLKPDGIAGRFRRIELPDPPTAETVTQMVQALGKLGREEL